MTKTANTYVRENVRRERQRRGWSQAAMSERLAQLGHRLTVPVLSKIELGDRDIEVDDLVAFAAVFELPVEQLLVDPMVATSELATWLWEAWRRAVSERLAADAAVAEAEQALREAAVDDDVAAALEALIASHVPEGSHWREDLYRLFTEEAPAEANPDRGQDLNDRQKADFRRMAG
jgi:transcriptional regulator with XRE-family HTH domain